MDLVEAKARGFESPVRHPWEQARLSLVHRLIQRHANLRPGDTVLDIGCGDTFVAEALARRYPGVQFNAVDSNFTDQLIDTFRARLTVPNVSLFASLESVPVSKPAALVLLMDVIEHVPDDVAFLGGICQSAFVGRDTRLLITVPSFQSLFCSHDRFLGHYRRYSGATLRTLFNRVKLQCEEGGYLFASLLPVRVLQVLRERIAGSREAPTDLATWGGGAAKARTLASVLTLDGRISLALVRVGIRIPGLSNFAICRKSA
jgi:methyltransferase family protein